VIARIRENAGHEKVRHENIDTDCFIFLSGIFLSAGLHIFSLLSLVLIM